MGGLAWPPQDLQGLMDPTKLENLMDPTKMENLVADLNVTKVEQMLEQGLLDPTKLESILAGNLNMLGMGIDMEDVSKKAKKRQNVAVKQEGNAIPSLTC